MISPVDSKEAPRKSMTWSLSGKIFTRQKINLDYSIRSVLELREYQAAMSGRDDFVVELSMPDLLKNLPSI
jgi:hypothetical protein